MVPHVVPAAVIASSVRSADIVLPLEKWVGVVTQINGESFRARVVDEMNGSAEEEVEFAAQALSPADVELLQPGSVFYWVIGYRDTSYGQRMNVSTIRFRRLTSWNEADIETARIEAEQLRRDLDLGTSE